MTSTPPTSSVVLISGRVTCQYLRVGLKGRLLPISRSALDHVPSDHLCHPHGDLFASVVCERVGSVRVQGKVGHRCTIPVDTRGYLIIALTSNAMSLSISMGSKRAVLSLLQCIGYLLEILGTDVCSNL